MTTRNRPNERRDRPLHRADQGVGSIGLMNPATACVTGSA